MSMRSVYWVRTVRTKRSACAFIRGACGAVLMISIPIEAKTESNVSVNFASRSRISRNLKAIAAEATATVLEQGRSWIQAVVGSASRVRTRSASGPMPSRWYIASASWRFAAAV